MIILNQEERATGHIYISDTEKCMYSGTGSKRGISKRGKRLSIPIVYTDCNITFQGFMDLANPLIALWSLFSLECPATFC